MTDKDMKWLKELNEKSWRHHEAEKWPDGSTKSYGHSEDLPIVKEDREKLLNLLRFYKKQLIFEPGGGVFGFGVSITAFIPKPAPYPGIPDELEQIICVTSKQMFPKHGVSEMNKVYQAFMEFTHSEHNKKAREAVGFKDKLKDYSYYDY